MSSTPDGLSFGELGRLLADAVHVQHMHAILLIDCAGWPGGRPALLLPESARVDSLFSGDVADELGDVGPCIAQLSTVDERVTDAVRALLQAEAAVLVFAAPPQDGDAEDVFRSARQHFRKFNVVYSSAGVPMMFRYFDPLVLFQASRTFDAEAFSRIVAPFSAVYAPVRNRLVNLVLAQADARSSLNGS